MSKLDWKKDLLKKISIKNFLKTNFLDHKTAPARIFPDYNSAYTHFFPSEFPREEHFINSLADAELEFEQWQLQNGREVSQRGVGPQDASELQNLMAYQDSEGIQETINPFNDAISDSFGSQDNFQSYGNPAETIDDMQQPAAVQPEEMSALGSPELIDTSPDHNSMAPGPEPVQTTEPMLPQQEQAPLPEPMPDPMDDPLKNPFDPMDPMAMGPFDPMDPMGFGGPFGL